MKEIVFISGKGGTGKSTIVASLAMMIKDKMIADCDVDAPNLHILLDGKVRETIDYYGAKEAFINEKKCTECGICRETCHFDAISTDFAVSSLKCEGCGACTLVCPAEAITLKEVKTGETYISDTQYGTFSHALLDTGAEGSGKLVTQVRKNASRNKRDEEWLLIDGSPGTGCVVIASITGANAAVVVTEPTMSGVSDLKRILAVAKHFGIPGYVCINKYDLNEDITAEIEKFCNEENYSIIGMIPFEPGIVKALQEFKAPPQAGLDDISARIAELWENLKEEIERL
jgi:MinD superfamily P-loop ATPase